VRPPTRGVSWLWWRPVTNVDTSCYLDKVGCASSDMRCQLALDGGDKRVHVL
jgi:hypothetical protein